MRIGTVFTLAVLIGCNGAREPAASSSSAPVASVSVASSAAPAPAASASSAATETTATTATAPPVTAPKKVVTSMKGAKPDQAIALRGRISKIPWQHLMTGVTGKKAEYFDLEGGKDQTVVYWKDPPSCSGDIVVVGKVLEVRGPPKKPGGRDTKVDDSYSELHVDVDSARCGE